MAEPLVDPPAENDSSVLRLRDLDDEPGRAGEHPSARGRPVRRLDHRERRAELDSAVGTESARQVCQNHPARLEDRGQLLSQPCERPRQIIPAPGRLVGLGRESTLVLGGRGRSRRSRLTHFRPSSRSSHGRLRRSCVERATHRTGGRRPLGQPTGRCIRAMPGRAEVGARGTHAWLRQKQHLRRGQRRLRLLRLRAVSVPTKRIEEVDRIRRQVLPALLTDRACWQDADQFVLGEARLVPGRIVLEWSRSYPATPGAHDLAPQRAVQPAVQASHGRPPFPYSALLFYHQATR